MATFFLSAVEIRIVRLWVYVRQKKCDYDRAGFVAKLLAIVYPAAC